MLPQDNKKKPCTPSFHECICSLSWYDMVHAHFHQYMRLNMVENQATYILMPNDSLCVIMSISMIQSHMSVPHLSPGEIPDLYSDEEEENIINNVRNEVKSQGLMDSRENCWKFFIERVQRQLKVQKD